CNGHLEAAWAAHRQAAERVHKHGSQPQRWYWEFGVVMLLVLEGKAEEAWKRIGVAAKHTRFGVDPQSPGVSGLWGGANAAPLRAREKPSTRRAMIAVAQRMARRMEKENAPWINSLAQTVRACIASLSGDQDGALRLLTVAEPLLETHHFEGVVAAARLRRG